jgi:hypothetical protein
MTALSGEIEQVGDERFALEIGRNIITSARLRLEARRLDRRSIKLTLAFVRAVTRFRGDSL